MGLWVLGKLRADLTVIWEELRYVLKPSYSSSPGRKQSSPEHKILTVGGRVSRGIESGGIFWLKNKQNPLPTKLEKGEKKEGGILLSAISCCHSKPSKVFRCTLPGHIWGLIVESVIKSRGEPSSKTQAVLAALERLPANRSSCKIPGEDHTTSCTRAQLQAGRHTQPQFLPG